MLHLLSWYREVVVPLFSCMFCSQCCVQPAPAACIPCLSVCCSNHAGRTDSCGWMGRWLNFFPVYHHFFFLSSTVLLTSLVISTVKYVCWKKKHYFHIRYVDIFIDHVYDVRVITLHYLTIVFILSLPCTESKTSHTMMKYQHFSIFSEFDPFVQLIHTVQ